MKNQSAPWANIRRRLAAKIWPVSEPAGQQDQQPVQRIIVPAYNPTRILGMAREMRTPHFSLVPLDAWMRNHGQDLPPTRQAGPIAQPPEQAPALTAVSDVLDAPWLNSGPVEQSTPIPETPLATTALPDWLTAPMPTRVEISQQVTLPGVDESRALLLAVDEQDCTPDLSEGMDSDATESIASILKLRYCEHKKKGA